MTTQTQTTPAAAPAALYPNLPISEAWGRVHAARYVIDRLTQAGGGLLPNGQARWTLANDSQRLASRGRRRYAYGCLLRHAPSGMEVVVALDLDPADPVHPITLTIDSHAAGRKTDLNLRVTRAGDADWSRVAGLAAAATAHRLEARERERIQAQAAQARLVAFRTAFLTAMQEDGVLDLLPAAYRVAGNTAGLTASEDTGNLPRITWAVPGEGAYRHVLTFQAREMGGRRAWTPDDIRALKVCAGHRYSSWDSPQSDLLPWGAAVRLLKHMAAAALAHRADVAVLTAGEGAPAASAETTH